jgi:zinc protease
MRPSLRVLALAVLAVLAAGALAAQDAHAQPRLRDFLGPVQQRRLDNGLTVVVQEDHHVPLVSLTLRYDGGEAASPPGLEGTATVVEHLLFQGATKHVPAGDYARLLARAGATGVHDNVWINGIGFDVTLPANRLALPLWLWSDQMGFFGEGLTDEQLASTKTKVREQERAMLDGAPTARADVFAAEELFPAGHPNRAWYMTPQSIDRIDRAAVSAFHDKWIAPARATLVVVGDVSAPDAFALVDQYFGPYPRTEEAREPPPQAPPLPGEAQVDVAAIGTVAHVSVRWLTPRDLTTDDARLDVVGKLLAGHQTGWLSWKLVEEQKVATRVTARQRSGPQASQFEVWIDGAKGKSAGEILAALDRAMDGVRARTAQSREISGAIYEVLVDDWLSLEGAPYRAQRYARFSALVGTPEYLDHNYDRYRGITAAVVRETITKWLPPDRRVVLLVTPTPGAAPGGERTGRRFTQAVSP